MIANLTRGAKTASLHLPADRFQIAGVLSYLGVDRLDDYELLCEGQDSSGIMISLEPTGIAERNIAELCRNEKISLGRLNSGFRSLFKLPYEQQLGVMDRIANQKPEHFDDFRKAIDAATVPSVRQEYYFPLTVNLYTANRWGDYDDDPEEYDGRFAARYEDKIRQALRVYNRDDGEDMAAYFHGNNTVVAKLRSATWDFKRRGGELYGCVTVETAGQLTAEQEADLKDWIAGQNSDGLGEGFEQQEINIDSYSSSGRICVSFWHSGDDYFVDNEDEFAERLEQGFNLDRNGVGDKKLSGAVIRSMHTRIKSALDQAQKEGLVNRNEAVGCKLPPKKNKEVEVLSHDEMRRLLIQAKAEGFYEMILLTLASGLRRGELLGLRWEDINFETCELSVRREYTTLGSEYIVSTPKTKASVRTIKIPQSVVRIFEEYRKTVDSEWVFPSPLDKTKPRSPTSCRSKLSDMLDRAECKHIPFHGLRHIFATNGIENGMDIKTLSAILGHSSAETTIGTYSHVTGLMEKRAAEKLDQAFGNRTEEDSTATPTAEPKPAKFIAKQGKKRKPGTGCISQVSKNTWQGKYTPWNPDGTRQCHCVYATTREECERKLGEMIAKLKVEEGSIIDTQ